MTNFLFIFYMLFASKDTDGIRAVQVTQLFPYLDTTGHFKVYDTLTARLFYYDGMMAIQAPIWHQQHSFTNIYYIAKQDSSFGYTYAENDSTGFKGRRLSKDRFIHDYTSLEYIYGYQAFHENVMTLVSSKVDKSTGDLNEVYSGYSKKDTSGKGTCYYTYTNRMKNIPFSLSPQLDSIKQMKLRKIRIVHPAGYVKEYKRFVGEFDGVYTMDEISVPGNHEVFKFFKEYRENISNK